MSGLFLKITQRWNDFLLVVRDFMVFVWKFDLSASIDKWTTELNQSMCNHVSTVSIGTNDPEYSKRYLWVKCLECEKILHCTEWFNIEDWAEGCYSSMSLKVEQNIED